MKTLSDVLLKFYDCVERFGFIQFFMALVFFVCIIMIVITGVENLISLITKSVTTRKTVFKPSNRLKKDIELEADVRSLRDACYSFALGAIVIIAIYAVQ
jgi:hypothetical protein